MQRMIPPPTLHEQKSLIESLAPVRLRRFRAATSGDRAAVRLYLLDSEISSHMHATVRVIEVALREHLHRALTAAFDERWFVSQRGLFDEDLAEKIDSVLAEVGEKAPAGKVVAQLMFGSWASLLGRGGSKADGTSARYVQTIWDPVLSDAFDGVTRKELRRAAMSLNWARNRSVECVLEAYLRHLAGSADGLRCVDLVDSWAGVSDREEELGVCVQAGGSIAPIHQWCSLSSAPRAQKRSAGSEVREPGMR